MLDDHWMPPPSSEEERFYDLLDGRTRANAAMSIGYKIAIWATWFVVPVYGTIEERFGLNRADLFLLTTLNGGEEMTATQISLITSRPKNTVSRAVKRLRETGYIDWRQSTSDARTAYLRITQKGQDLYNQILPLFAERQREILTPLVAQERMLLDQIMSKLMAHAYPWTIRR